MASRETPSQLFQFLWYNNYIKNEDASIHFEKLSNKISVFYHNYLKMTGPYHESISQR